MKDMREIITVLGGPKGIYRDMQITSHLAHGWFNNNSIPAPYWARLQRLCRRKGVKLTAAELVKMVSKGD